QASALGKTLEVLQQLEERQRLADVIFSLQFEKSRPQLEEELRSHLSNVEKDGGLSGVDQETLTGLLDVLLDVCASQVRDDAEQDAG
ncbi:unnamed protein product, partial [Amoebophrya sp. A25]